MAAGVLYPSGLPSRNPFKEPEPENTDTLALSSFISVLVSGGPTVSTPFLIMEPSERVRITTSATRPTATTAATINRIFFIIKEVLWFTGPPSNLVGGGHFVKNVA